MSEEIIYNCKIEHEGDFSKAFDYLRQHWNNKYILDVFENAKTSKNRTGDFRIPNIPGTYILKFIGEHHYSLSWRNY